MKKQTVNTNVAAIKDVDNFLQNYKYDGLGTFILTITEHYQGRNISFFVMKIFLIEFKVYLLNDISVFLVASYLNVLLVLSEGTHIYTDWNWTILLLLVGSNKVWLSIWRSVIRSKCWFNKYFRGTLVFLFHFYKLVVGVYFYWMFYIVASNVGI